MPDGCVAVWPDGAGSAAVTQRQGVAADAEAWRYAAVRAAARAAGGCGRAVCALSVAIAAGVHPAVVFRALGSDQGFRRQAFLLWEVIDA